VFLSTFTNTTTQEKMLTANTNTKYSSLLLDSSLWGDAELIDEINQENNALIDVINQSNLKPENNSIVKEDIEIKEDDSNLDLLNLLKLFCHHKQQIEKVICKLNKTGIIDIIKKSYDEKVIMGEVLPATSTSVIEGVVLNKTEQISEVCLESKNIDNEEVENTKITPVKEEESKSPIYSPIPFTLYTNKNLSVEFDNPDEFPGLEIVKQKRKKVQNVGASNLELESKFCMNLLKFGNCTKLLCENNHGDGMIKCNFGKECNKVYSSNGVTLNVDDDNRCFFIHPNESNDMFFHRHKINNKELNNKVAECKFGINCLKVKRSTKNGQFKYTGYNCTFIHPNETIENYKNRRNQ
jgi:hypothetical protein